MDTILEARDLKKHFQTKNGLLHAVDGISFTLQRGKTLGIVGESGCGKSTLGRVVLHLLESTSGQLLFEGQDITHVRGRELKMLRRDMQMIFQDPLSSLDPRKTVSQTIGEPLRIYKACKTRDEYEQKVATLMELVGLAPRLADSYPHELDGGRRQRICIGRALALNPKLIVCDEPVSALDVSIQAQILNLMMDLKEKKALTYLFISHDLSVVKHISDEIMVMYLGMMVEKSEAKELFAKQYHPYTKALLAAIPEPKLRNRRERILLEGEISSPINVKPGCRFAPRCPYAKEICRTVTPELEEMTPGHYTACHCVREVNEL
ncbi:MAG: ATP-binding cassette domain-containing protein [Lachnospiraceae bacterium]|nr:ATP-binding cassette domain-containing protein [Lachnospiraceae bacterium]